MLKTIIEYLDDFPNQLDVLPVMSASSERAEPVPQSGNLLKMVGGNNNRFFLLF